MPAVSFFIDSLKNIFRKEKIIFITEQQDWSIFWDGFYIKKYLSSKTGIALSKSPLFLKNKILHFGSVNTFISGRGLTHVDPSNTVIVTWFHVAPDDPRIKWVPKLNEQVDIVHTSCLLTKNKLLAAGLREEKIRVIPLGVDTQVFAPYTTEQKETIRKQLGIAPGTKVIGSFQKDGVGWKEGNEAKYIKGPDIFCDAAQKISQHTKIHVLLTGPARGYVISRLQKLQIPFTHVFCKNYLDIVEMYNALDLYLITSREEGGPKALLESLSTGVPLVSTPVGMVPEILTSENGVLVDTFDASAIASAALALFENPERMQKLVEQGRKDILLYDWKSISSHYYESLYKPYVR